MGHIYLITTLYFFNASFNTNVSNLLAAHKMNEQCTFTILTLKLTHEYWWDKKFSFENVSIVHQIIVEAMMNLAKQV